MRNIEIREETDLKDINGVKIFTGDIVLNGQVIGTKYRNPELISKYTF